MEHSDPIKTYCPRCGKLLLKHFAKNEEPVWIFCKGCHKEISLIIRPEDDPNKTEKS
jgi:hypothetical protein